MEDFDFKKSLSRAKVVKIWFWDTVTEYAGEAVELTSKDLKALLKMGGSGVATVIPSQAVIQGLVKHLTGRVVEFKISGQAFEVVVKGTINEVQRDFEIPGRLFLIATFAPTSERNQTILDRLGQILKE